MGDIGNVEDAFESDAASDSPKHRYYESISSHGIEPRAPATYDLANR